MISDDVKQTIYIWTKWAATDGAKRYDIALFKILIQFEKFLGDLFITYATGNASESGYTPQLKLRFIDEEHFNIFMREGNKKYIEYLNKIEKLSPHIFEKNPFDVILEDIDISPAFKQMKAIRNYIAHESGESKRKLIDMCFNGSEQYFLEPNDYLLSIEKTTKKSYYTYYIDIIKTIIELITYPN